MKEDYAAHFEFGQPLLEIFARVGGKPKLLEKVRAVEGEVSILRVLSREGVSP